MAENVDLIRAAISAGCMNVEGILDLAEKYQLIGYLVDQGFTLRKIRSIKDPKAIDMVRKAMLYAIYTDKHRAERPFKNDLVSVRVVGGPSLNPWKSAVNPYLQPPEGE